MFLKTAEIKKEMTAALKSSGLVVGMLDGRYYVRGRNWGLYAECESVSNKFKGAVTELVGCLPEPGEINKYMQGKDGMQTEVYELKVYPYQAWIAAKEGVRQTPVLLGVFPHVYAVFQHAETLEPMAVRQTLINAISGKELEEGETMPGQPSMSYGTLYWHNETTIYWAETERMAEKVRDVLFPALMDVDFSADDWRKTQLGTDGTVEAESLPYI